MRRTVNLSQWRVRVLSTISRALVIALAAAFALPLSAQAQDARGTLIVSIPNGYPNITANDMQVRSTAGSVRWSRTWDGQEWKFNPQWESLSQSWKNLTGSQSADTTGSTVSSSSSGAGTGGLSSSGLASGGGGDSGCWVWVDEDWSPTIGTTVIGGIPAADPLVAARTTPFNRIMGESDASQAQAQDYPPAQIVSIDYASLCAGSVSGGSAIRDTEGIRLANELYLGDNGRYAFNNRSVLEKRAVRQLPAANAAAEYTSLATGQIAVAPIDNAKGFRWIDKSGDWIDYNTQGQVVVWGDKNNNMVWLLRDTDGMVRGAVDANGRVIFSLHYSGQLLIEVRDYAASATDLPLRSVKYQYDANNRLSVVTDLRGNTVKYEYDVGNHITKITDQEGHAEVLAYSGDTVSKRTAADGGVTDYLFDYDDVNKQFASTITGPETAAGRKVDAFTHNRVGKLVRQIVNGRTDVEVLYDTGARAEIRTNARGFTTRVTRNEFDQVVQLDFPDGANQKRSYSAVHLGLAESTDELGNKTQYQYDLKGNPLKRIDAVGTTDERTTDRVVNDLGQITSVTRRGRTEANGTVTADATWLVEYDALGQVKKITDAEGKIFQYTADRTGNLQVRTDPLGNTWRYEVDATGNLTKTTDPLGRASVYQYDKAGNVLQLTDARAKTIHASYDAMNRRLQIVNEVGGTHRVQYDAQGLPIAETDEDGRASSAEFDNFMRITKEVDGVGNTTTYGYNIPDGTNAGSLGSLFDPTQTVYPTFTQQQRYDARERVTSETLLNPNSLGTEGLVSTTAYDKRGQIVSDTDANGKTHTYAYSALGQLIATTDSLGNRTQAQYDARGNLIQITDAKGNSNKFEFDRNDRLVKETLPMGQRTITQYDAAGNVQERVDPNGSKIDYTYDAANRLATVKQYDAGNTLVRTTGYTWDALDNLTAWTDTDSLHSQTASATATFDDASRKTSETITYPAGNTLSFGYSYSSAGYKTQLTWPDGTPISYSYSGHGELESVTIPNEGSISVNEFKWFAPAKITLPGGSNQERTLDGLLDLEALKVKTPGQTTVLSIANTYGKVQELKQSNRADSVGAVTSVRNSSYAYDDQTRLTQATTDVGGLFGRDTENYTLDAVGNRIAYSKVSGAWTYDANNRLTQRGTGSNATNYQYDAAGNLTRKTEPGNKVTQYAYDTQSRLIEVKDGSANPIARYGYDPFDRRIWKEQFRDKDGNALAQAQRITYLYADEGIIAEASQFITLNNDLSVTANGNTAIVTEYGPRPDAEFTTGVLFVKTQDSNGQPRFAYYHHDQIGTPVQATDKAGNIVWAASYNAFGQASITTPAATTAIPTIVSSLRLPGQVEDAETGLHYNFRRYYDPSTGRYITQDPIGAEGGDNFYRYAEADPVNLTDPTGECPMCVAYAVCVAECVLEDVAINAVTGECNNFGDSAKSCAVGCLLGPLSKVGKWFKRAKDVCSVNSFTEETLVHMRPGDAHESDATLARAELKPISSLKVGDEVLALSEWKAQGSKPQRDERLSYEKVTDVFTSYQAHQFVYITLEDGQVLTATEGHPFRTTEGWRDAVLLEKDNTLLLKDSDIAGGSERAARIVAISHESRTLPVYNIEVANAGTYFIGEDGELVHNGRCGVKPGRYWRKEYEKREGKPWPKTDEGDNYHAHHKDPLADGGKDVYENITPMHPADHFEHHAEDRRRWGGRGRP